MTTQTVPLGTPVITEKSVYLAVNDIDNRLSSLSIDGMADLPAIRKAVLQIIKLFGGTEKTNKIRIKVHIPENYAGKTVFFSQNTMYDAKINWGD